MSVAVDLLILLSIDAFELHGFLGSDAVELLLHSLKFVGFILDFLSEVFKVDFNGLHQVVDFGTEFRPNLRFKSTLV